jgi:predicted esterase
MKPGSLSVTRTARFVTLGPDPATAREIWIALHGYAQLAERFLTLLAPLDDGETHIVAPEALSRFYLETRRDGHHSNIVGATWLTREARETDLEDHLRYLDHLAKLVIGGRSGAPRVVIMGFSQGAVMAARWMAQGRVVPDAALLWGAPLPTDVRGSELARHLAGRPVTLLAGEADPVVPAGTIEANAEALRAAGIDGTAIRFPGGHEIPAETLRRAAGRQ